MYIQRSIMLGLLLLLVSFPAISDWLTSDYTAWYRPYILWSLVIIAAWWGQHTRSSDEL